MVLFFPVSAQRIPYLMNKNRRLMDSVVDIEKKVTEVFVFGFVHVQTFGK